MKIKLFLFTFLLLLLISCEKIFFKPNIETKDPYENFDYLWNKCDRLYVYFDLKNIDWDSIKHVYRSQLREDMNEIELFNVLGEMMLTLRDGHAGLISDFDSEQYLFEYFYPDNFEWRVIVDNYIGLDYYYTGHIAHQFIRGYNIGYLRISAFKNLDKEDFIFTLNRYKNTDGLIIDVRDNGGGSIMNIFTLLSFFTSEKKLIYYERIKNGPSHNDFSAPTPVYVSPSEPFYSNPVILLTDRGSYSATSLLSLGAKAFDNIIQIGDTTGGGLGLPSQHQLPNGWTFSFSVSQALTLDKKPDYELGVPPDSIVMFDWNDLSKDEILEKAIEIILNYHSRPGSHGL